MYKINKPIRLIELFAGIGSQAMALRDIGADYTSYKAIEYDAHVVDSYNAIHNTNYKPTDIRDINGAYLDIKDTDKFEYIITYSFPCQDLSNEGNKAGLSGARSGLLWEVERLLNELQTLPQVLIMENVPHVHYKRNIKDFNKWLSFLERKGYHNYYQDLNAKDYGVAQNRDRCFMISLLSDAPYEFPKPIKLTKTVRDYYETAVDDSYNVLNPKMLALIHKSPIKNTVYIKQATKAGVILCKLNGVAHFIYPSSKLRRGRVINNGDVSPTLTTGQDSIYKVDGLDKIRKLTPLEHWRLMSFSDADYYKAQSVNKATELYKQAGNSIVEDVLKAIFSQML